VKSAQKSAADKLGARRDEASGGGRPSPHEAGHEGIFRRPRIEVAAHFYKPRVPDERSAKSVRIGKARIVVSQSRRKIGPVVEGKVKSILKTGVCRQGYFLTCVGRRVRDQVTKMKMRAFRGVAFEKEDLADGAIVRKGPLVLRYGGASVRLKVPDSGVDRAKPTSNGKENVRNGLVTRNTSSQL
jgi:hypothetical protein